MPTKSLFTALSLDDDFSPEILRQELIQSLAQTDVYATFRWTEGRKIRFLDVQVEYDGNWRNVLEESINADSGAQSFFLGNFSSGASLTLAFILRAYTAVEKIVVLISEETPPLATQVAPPPPKKKKLDSGDNWSEDAIPYEVVGTAAVA